MDEVLAAISKMEFVFAKTMPDIPHWYVVRANTDEADYIALFDAIEKYGIRKRWGKYNRKYLEPGDGYKYWHMAEVNGVVDMSVSRVINRAKV